MNLDHICAAATVRAKCSEQKARGHDTVTVPRETLERFMEMHDAYEAARNHLAHWAAHADIAMEDAAATLAKTDDLGNRMLARRLTVAREKLVNVGFGCDV